MRRIVSALLLFCLFASPVRAEDQPKRLPLARLEVGQVGTLLWEGRIVFPVVEVQGDDTILVDQYVRALGERKHEYLVIKGISSKGVEIGKPLSVPGVFKVTEKITIQKKPAFVLEKIK